MATSDTQMIDDVVYAYRLDGRGGGVPVDLAELGVGWSSRDSLHWIHLNRGGPRTGTWLREESGLDPLVCDALLAASSRPRCTRFGEGLLLNLRGVNLNPGADPEDMVSVRLWIDGNRIVSVRRRKVMAVSDIRDAIDAGHGPATAGDFIADLASRLVERMEPVISDLDDAVDALEDSLVEGNRRSLRADLVALRRTAIGLRRYIAPQREATNRLLVEDVAWIEPRSRGRLREVADRVVRYVEDLDAARERASLTQEEMSARVAEEMNRNTYVLSIVAAIFLPLGLITGLLGINVGGIPGTEWHWAFATVCGVLGILAVLEVWLFRRLKWI